MKNIIKKTIAAAFCGTLLLSTAACADTSWSIKNDDETLSIGTYIYYMSQAYGEAKEKSEKKGNDLLSATIEKKTGDEWIRSRAKELCVEQLTVNKLCKDNKVAATDDEINDAYNASNGYYSYAQMWIYTKQTYEAMGISEDSYKDAVVGTSLNKSKLFDKIYGEGGSQEVKESDLEKYFTENYVYYKYFSTPFTTTDEDGKSTTLTDEEKERVKVRYENYVKMINNESKTMDDVIEKYKKDTETETDPSMTSCDNLNKDFVLGDTVKNKLKETAEGKAAYVATDNGYYFVYKLPIKDKVSDLTNKEDTSTRSEVLHALKDEDFTKYIEEQAKNTKYEQNDAAFNKYTPSRVIPDSDNESSEESSNSSEGSTEKSTESESASTASAQESNTSTASESSKESGKSESSVESSTSSKVSSETASKSESSSASATESSSESSAA